MNFFIDDVKNPEWYFDDLENVRVFRDAESALQYVKEKEVREIEDLYLDHDLGQGLNGYECLTKLIELGVVLKRVICISWNAAGSQRIFMLCDEHSIPRYRSI